MSDVPYASPSLKSIEVTTAPTDSTFNTTRFNSPPPLLQEGGSVSTITNSGLQPMTTYTPYFRSSFELLRSLPSQEDLMKVSPYLPTNRLTSDALDASIPHPVRLPLADSVFEKSPSSPELEIVAIYHRLLDIREGLRVEEVVLEMRMDRDRLYLNPPMYHAAEKVLEGVRVLIMRACESLSYIEEECAWRRVELDTFHVDQGRMVQRPPEHPFNMIIKYLNPGGLLAFNNFQAYHSGEQREVSEASEMPNWDPYSSDASPASGSADSTPSTYIAAPTTAITTNKLQIPPFRKASRARPRNVERGGSFSASESESSASVASNSEPTNKSPRWHKPPPIFRYKFPCVHHHTRQGPDRKSWGVPLHYHRIVAK